MNKRVYDLEFRWTLSYGENATKYPEIVRWYERKEGDPFCCTLLYWVRDSEGWRITFVGDRPFDNEVDKDALWALMKYGQSVSDAQFKLESDMRDL